MIGFNRNGGIGNVPFQDAVRLHPKNWVPSIWQRGECTSTGNADEWAIRAAFIVRTMTIWDATCWNSTVVSTSLQVPAR